MDHKRLIQELEDNMLLAGDCSYLIYCAVCVLKQQQEEIHELKSQLSSLQQDYHKLLKLNTYNPLKEV